MSEIDACAETPRPGPEPLAVRVPEACRMIGIGRSKLYELIADGTIAIVKIGSVTVIPMAQLRALIELGE